MTAPPSATMPLDAPLDPLERRLQRVAAGSGPAPGVLEATERQVIAAFEAHRSEPIPGVGARSRWRRIDARRHQRSVRHVLATGLAAASILVAGAAVASAESAPGHPLYAARLALERALLPTDPPADRLAAQLAVLDRRLSEMTQAASDVEAVADATQAYRATLAELLPLVHRAPEQTETAGRALAAQLGTIDRLLAKVAPAARRDLADAARAVRALLAAIGHEDRDGPDPSVRRGGSAGPPPSRTR